MGLGSAAIAAWTAAIFSASEFTQIKPELWATSASSLNGRTKGRSFGMPAATAGVDVGIATGAATGVGAAGGVAADSAVASSTIAEAGAWLSVAK